ncbi:MAG: PRC-barrel domain-containing protein [Pseudomonadota bacterium]
MLRNTQELKSYTIGATDGEVGKVADVFFDDQSWVVRYIVVDTGSWLTSRKVLISPYAVQRADWEHKRLPVNLSREQVKNSPDIDTDMPVSRQHEMAYADYYRYPYYWGLDGFWGDGLYSPMEPMRSDADERYAQAERARDQNDDPHLRSCKAVVGYHIHASDGDIGHVQSMLVDEETWAIRYLVVDTSNWWMGHKVLIPPEWITNVNWADSSVTVDLTRATVQNSPRYESSEDLNRSRELELYSHYGRPNYWEREHARESIPMQFLD